MMAANCMAKALGVWIPPLVETVKVRVSMGLLFRAKSIASCDYDAEESFVFAQMLAPRGRPPAHRIVRDDVTALPHCFNGYGCTVARRYS